MASSVLAELQVKIGANIDGLNKNLKRTESKMQGFERKMGGIAAAIGGVFAVGEAINFGKQIVAVTSEFQKLNAVLSNALGSDSSAELAFKRLQDFASKTPFTIQELTGSFVKLVSRGIRPTMDQMRQLGDIASSQGKSFDQLSEAILDAASGQYERLREFGIVAQKAGDQVKFTFKGISTSVANTDKAITNYLYTLGDAEGVSGSMAKISDTLGGKISNLDDVFTTFQANLGAMNSGVLSETIDYFIKLGNAANRIMTTDVADRVVTSEGIKQAEERLKMLEARLQEIYANNEKVKNMTYGEAKASGEDPQYISESGINKVIEAIKRQKAVLAQLKQEKQEIAAATTKQVEAEKEAAVQAEASKGILGRLEEQLKKVKELRDTSNSTAEISAYNHRIDKIGQEISKLKELGRIKELPLAAGLGFNYEAMIPPIPDLSEKITQIKGQTQEITETFSQMAASIEYAMESAVMNFAYGLGQMISTGQGLDFSMLLAPFADLAIQIGQLAITSGLAIEGLSNALKNPFAGGGIGAVIAGVALVAVGSAIKGSLSRMASGGGSVGGGISGGGSAKPGAYIGNTGSDANNQLEFVIKGNTLVAALSKAQQQKLRLG